MFESTVVFETRTKETNRILHFISAFERLEDRHLIQSFFTKFGVAVTKNVELGFLMHFHRAISGSATDVAEIVARYQFLKSLRDPGLIVTDLVRHILPQHHAVAINWVMDAIVISRAEITRFEKQPALFNALVNRCSEEINTHQTSMMIDWLIGELATLTLRSSAHADKVPITFIIKAKQENKSVLTLLMENLK